MSEPTIRVVVVDDHTIVRKGTSALFAMIDYIEVVGEAGNGYEAIDLVELVRPDVVLMDLVMPGMDGIDATRHITANYPNVRILALTSFAADDKVFPAIKAGALGYLLKDADPNDLIRAVRQVYHGEPWLQPEIARKLLNELRSPTPTAQNAESLTAREIEVLRHVARGWTNEDIAQALGVSEVTIRTHVSNILGKLHLENRVQATLYALKRGISKLDEDEEKSSKGKAGKG
jgi:two-component system, NarL family, response regulator LiaR